MERDAASTFKRPRKTSELIAREIAREVVQRDLSEGARLPNERDMVERFGVGRGTLREALRLLETRGVLTIRTGSRGGAVVRRPRPEDLGDALTLMLQFQRASFRDVIEARQALEPMLTRLATERIDAEGLAALDESVQLILDNLGDQEIFLAQNLRFHQTIAKASGSVVLRGFSDSLKAIADGALVGVRYTARRHQGVAEAHAKVAAAVRGGDPEWAEQTMRAHLDEASTFWRRKYANLVSRPVEWVD